MTKITVSELNSLCENKFLSTFENIVEYYPSMAKHLCENRPYNKKEDFTQKALNFLEELPLKSKNCHVVILVLCLYSNTGFTIFLEKELILKLHPDLAGKLSEQGKLTIESTNEQKAAGLDSITSAQKLDLQELNQR